MKLYHAMIWARNPDGTEKPGKRVSVLAENIHEAREKLEAEYGKGNVYCLSNEEDAERIR
jgi:hypothetical protein